MRDPQHASSTTPKAEQDAAANPKGGDVVSVFMVFFRPRAGIAMRSAVAAALPNALPKHDETMFRSRAFRERNTCQI